MVVENVLKEDLQQQHKRRKWVAETHQDVLGDLLGHSFALHSFAIAFFLSKKKRSFSPKVFFSFFFLQKEGDGKRM